MSVCNVAAEGELGSEAHFAGGTSERWCHSVQLEVNFEVFCFLKTLLADGTLVGRPSQCTQVRPSPVKSKQCLGSSLERALVAGEPCFPILPPQLPHELLPTFFHVLNGCYPGRFDTRTSAALVLLGSSGLGKQNLDLIFENLLVSQLVHMQLLPLLGSGRSWLN